MKTDNFTGVVLMTGDIIHSRGSDTVYVLLGVTGKGYVIKDISEHVVGGGGGIRLLEFGYERVHRVVPGDRWDFKFSLN